MSAPYMPLFVADYLADTAHLSAAEHGAYLMLIMNYWQREKPLPADDRKLGRIARMSDAEWADARSTLVEFFVEQDGEWRHTRIDAELAVAQEKSSKAKASARASVAARRANVGRPLNDRSADAELLGEERIGEEREDTAGAASSGAGQPIFDLEEAERRCCEAAASDRLGDFAPIREIILGRKLDLDEVLIAIRARPAANGAVSSWKFYAKLLRDRIAERAPATASTGSQKVHVMSGTPEWEAWAIHEGKKRPADAKGGWYFPTRWPPKIEKAA